SGCLPILIQVPVFFALYKVLFVTIEMRHAPFFGWIKDLSAPDPLTVFNLFGLIPWDPTVIPVIGPFLHLAPWPLIMGVTMWLQMKPTPPPPDPTQAMIFNYMPIIFTFMLGSFPAGLVIYWAWNNTLSVTQQSVIMHRHGAKIELWDNLKSTWESLKNLFKNLFKKKSSTGVNGSSSLAARRRRRLPPLSSPGPTSKPAASCSRGTGSSPPPRDRPQRCRRCAASRWPLPAAPTSASRASSTRSPAGARWRASRIHRAAPRR